MAMTSVDRGYGPDDMGDDEQETEVSSYEEYIEDPPDAGLEVAEDADDDASEAYDWAERHPRAAGHDGVLVDDRPDESAEESAITERPNP